MRTDDNEQASRKFRTHIAEPRWQQILSIVLVGMFIAAIVIYAIVNG